MSKTPAKYTCPATGQAWSGRGLQPAWLKAALASGKKLTDFCEPAKAAKAAKAAKPAKPEPIVIAINDEIERDEDGFGFVMGVRENTASITISRERVAAIVEQLNADGAEVEVISLRDLVADGVEGADEAWAEFEDQEELTLWNPVPPSGDGWNLLMIAPNNEIALDKIDAYALWARPAVAAVDDTWGTAGHAQSFMLGRMIEVSKKRFTTLAERWSALPQREQAAVLRGLHADMQAVVKDAVKIIAANARVTFRAEVESVQFKGPTDVKAALKLVSNPDSHALADAAGGFVTVVIESLDDLLSVPEADLAGDPDNRPLFDQSTEGSALDTKPEEVEA